MITITVSGVQDKDDKEVTEISEVINAALKSSGQIPFVVGSTNASTFAYPSQASCVINKNLVRDSSPDVSLEHQTAALLSEMDKIIKNTLPYGFFDFLVKRTESEAYELAQEHGALVRIVSRDDIPLVTTKDYNRNRVNLNVYNNMVVGWTYG